MSNRWTIHKRVLAAVCAAVFAVVSASVLLPQTAYAATAGTAMYRLYNPNSGEHFYTASAVECSTLEYEGWSYEGIGWVAPRSSATPVYRLYSRTDHHYTTSAEERDSLVKAGWKYEGISWYSDDAKGVALYRQYNPNVNPRAKRNNSGSHNYTTSKDENDKLEKAGWKAEGIAWYGLAEYDQSVITSAESARNALLTGADIMGTSQTTAAQMAAYYKKVAGTSAYPSAVYSTKGAATIEQFCQIVMEESAAEGVRAEVVFCQAMWETGWLKFGGDVKVGQCNFAGLGATGGGVKGATFKDVREGVRAQVQHLKAYASTAALKNAALSHQAKGLIVERSVPCIPQTAAPYHAQP